MGAHKGRAKRAPGDASAIYAKVSPETRARLDAGARALNMSLAAYLDLVVGHLDVDEMDLPEWARKRLAEEQLPLRTSA